MFTLLSKIIKRIYRYILHAYSIIRPKPPVDILMDEWLERYGTKGRKKILYLSPKYDYNDKSRGLGYEEYCFLYTLRNMDVELLRLDIYTIADLYGKKLTNELIKEVALIENVDSIFFSLYLDIIDHATMKELTETYNKETALWLFDDDKRFNETKELTRCFAKVVTTIPYRHKERLENGFNSIFSNFCTNHYLYRDYNLKKVYDVVFIGQNYGNRQEYIDHLVSNGINVKAFGKGWEGDGRIGQLEMIEILNKAKIVLNFSSSAGHPEIKSIKGRVFEMPASGSFLLTEICDNLEEYFEIGKELDIFYNKKELLEKVKFYLENNDLREKIAQKGEERVLHDYTFEKEFKKIFELP